VTCALGSLRDASTSKLEAKPIRGLRGATALDGRGPLCAAATGGVLCAEPERYERVPASPAPDALTATLIQGTAGAVEVRTGDAFGCARTAAGQVSCWGKMGQWSEAGRGGDAEAQAEPVRGLAEARELAAGARHACAITTGGRVFCWGDNTLGQLGVSDMRCPADARPCATRLGCERRCAEPVEVEGLPETRHVAAGNAHTCAIAKDGEVYCWGGTNPIEVGGNDPSASHGAQRVMF
jgi:hypothetical protein